MAGMRVSAAATIAMDQISTRRLWACWFRRSATAVPVEENTELHDLWFEDLRRGSIAQGGDERESPADLRDRRGFGSCGGPLFGLPQTTFRALVSSSRGSATVRVLRPKRAA
jgi:hypothetical protein